MQVSAKLRNLHIAPRKVRLIADLVRGKSAKEAREILNFITKKAAFPMLKLLDSAMANAKNNFQLDPFNLYISKITVDEGQKMKRSRPRARGSAYQIQKKTSHINLVLDEIAGSLPAGRQAKIIKKAKEAAVSAERGPLTPGVDGETPGVGAPLKEKPKLKPVSEIKKPASPGVVKRIFRRKVF